MKKKKTNLEFKGELKKKNVVYVQNLLNSNLDKKGKLNAKGMWNIERNLV
jgi:hypothetical protein